MSQSGMSAYLSFHCRGNSCWRPSTTRLKVFLLFLACIGDSKDASSQRKYEATTSKMDVGKVGSPCDLMEAMNGDLSTSIVKAVAAFSLFHVFEPPLVHERLEPLLRP